MPDSDDALDPKAPQAFDGRSPAEIAGIEDAESGEAAEPEAPATTPPEGEPGEEAPSGPDFSFLNDDLKARLTEDFEKAIRDPKVWDEVKRGYLKNRDYTQKTQALSQQRKAIEEATRDAQLWRDLVSDPRRREYVLAYKPGTKAETPDETPDLYAMTPQQMLAYFDQRYGEKIKAAEQQGAHLALETLSAPVRHAERLNQIAAEWAETNDVAADLVEEAGKLIQGDFGQVTAIAPEQLPVLLQRYVAHVARERELKALQSKQQSNGKKVERARAASPRGGVSTVAPGPATLEQKLGRKPTAEDIFDAWLESRSLSERDLDEGIKTNRGRSR